MEKSIEERLRILNIITFLIVSVLIVISISASVQGMRSLADVLDENEKTRNFWNSIENEGQAFNNYLNTENPQAYEALLQASDQTETALEKLPCNYHQMTLEQYTQTNSIRNTYEQYKKLQQEILSMNSGQSEYTSKVSMYYVIQQYLESYAGKLQTMTVEQSSMRYQRQQSIFIIVPGICVITGILVIMIFIWFKHYIRRTIIEPVMVLSEQAKRISANDFSGEPLKAHGEDEIAVLVHSFEEMKSSTQNYINTMEEKHQVEKQLVETRYQMLKNQINPHFLFNTLNLIASTAEIEDAETTEKMIVTLSRLFRYNLKSQTSVMPLEQELKVVSDYMYLQQMRFGARIKYVALPADETLEILVPSFVLQPLVENAIVHGLSKSSTGGVIVVRSWCQNGLTWISVADTGVGMDENQCACLRENLKKIYRQEGESEKSGYVHTWNQERQDSGVEEKNTGTGIALTNIMERIQGMYRCSGFRLYSRLGHGTVIQLYFGEQNRVSDYAYSENQV